MQNLNTAIDAVESIENKKNQFLQYKVAHPKLMAAHKEVMQAISNPDSKLIFVYGPSHVGKTTLSEGVYEKIKNSFNPSLEENHGKIAVIKNEIIAPTPGKAFDWPDNIVRLLRELHDPVIMNREAKANTLFGFDLLGCENESRRLDKLRRTLERTLKHRKPKAILLDEAQHFGKGVKKLQDQLDYIKSISNCSGVPLVLFGTYEMLDLRNLSGQLSNRSCDIHFERYKFDNDKTQDITDFQTILANFAANIPFKVKPDLLGNWLFLYERSLGCIGTLKRWLVRAVNMALDDKKAETVTMWHLEATALSVEACEKMALETTAYENKLKNDLGAKKSDRLKELLGLKQVVSPSPASNQNQGKYKGQVGVPSPERYQCGTIG